MNRATPPPLSKLEKAVLIHAGALLLGSAWLYGGNIWWMRTALSIWASLGAGLTLAAFFQPGARGREARRKAWWLVPLALFSILVVTSLTNPSFRPVLVDGETAFVKSTTPRPFWPSTISPGLTFRAWWFGAGVYLSAFNLATVLQSRSALRRLFVLIAANTLVLSVLGTVQKLAGVGFYFGATESPNPRFFATFIYYNHWGAFMFLGLTTAAGLLFYYARRHQGRDLWHSPLPLTLLGVLLIATTAPVSASRASTVIAAIVLAVTMVHALVHVAAARRARQLNPWPPLLLILLLAITTTAAIGWLSYRSLTERYTETRRVIDADKSVFGGRAELYRDTWNLAREQPVFGWGLDTYAVAFQLIRPVSVNLRDRTQNIYATAHNDWLQSIAETGFVGTLLLMSMGIVPLSSLPRRMILHPLTAYPLLGCGLVLLYAWMEFPFSNGAVLISFWILFFSAIRHAELTAIRASHTS
jgi:O-antigen ligase